MCTSRINSDFATCTAINGDIPRWCTKIASLVRRRATSPATAPYDAERAAPPHLPAQSLVARILRAGALLLGVGVLTRGVLWLLACVPWR